MIEHRTVNRCIYCLRDDLPLTREHIVPLGLNGDWTLGRASCRDHARVTGRAELDALRGALLAPRAAYRFRTRNPKPRPTHFPLLVIDKGVQRTIQIPGAEYPAIVGLPVFPPPTHFTGAPPVSGIMVRHVPPIQVAGLTLEQLRQKYPFDELAIEVEYRPVLFARMIAKIGYGMAVLGLGLEGISDCYVRPHILGEATDVGRWVGCEQAPPRNPTTGLHAVELEFRGGEILAHVRLFAQFGAPEYVVIVGRP